MNNTNESKYLGQFPNATKVKVFHPKATPEGQLENIQNVIDNKIWQTDIKYSTIENQFRGNPVGNYMLIIPDRGAQRLGHIKGVLGRIARIVPISGQNKDIENQIQSLEQDKARIEKISASMGRNPNQDPKYKSIVGDLADLKRQNSVQPHIFPDQGENNIIPQIKIIFSSVKEIPDINELPVSNDFKKGTRRGVEKTNDFRNTDDTDYGNLGQYIDNAGLGENNLNESKKPIVFGLL